MTLPETDFNYDTTQGKRSDDPKFEKILKEYVKVVQALKKRCIKRYGKHMGGYFGV